MGSLFVGSNDSALAGDASGAGYMIGNSLSASLFTGPNKQGARLNDLTLQNSAYGLPIPIVYGSSRVAGNVIWMDKLTPKTITIEGEGGGKGGTYSPATGTSELIYTVSTAILICEGKKRLRRIWANSRLVYDAFDYTVPTLLRSNGMKVYRGTEDQEPDPTMEAVLGVGNVPAYRGLMYIVFTDLELVKFGNQLPTLSFEVVEEHTPPTAPPPVPSGPVLAPETPFSANYTIIDPTTGWVWSISDEFLTSQFTVTVTSDRTKVLIASWTIPGGSPNGTTTKNLCAWPAKGMVVGLIIPWILDQRRGKVVKFLSGAANPDGSVRVAPQFHDYSTFGHGQWFGSGPALYTPDGPMDAEFITTIGHHIVIVSTFTNVTTPAFAFYRNGDPHDYAYAYISQYNNATGIYLDDQSKDPPPDDAGSDYTPPGTYYDAADWVEGVSDPWDDALGQLQWSGGGPDFWGIYGTLGPSGLVDSNIWIDPGSEPTAQNRRHNFQIWDGRYWPPRIVQRYRIAGDAHGQAFFYDPDRRQFIFYHSLGYGYTIAKALIGEIQVIDFPPMSPEDRSQYKYTPTFNFVGGGYLPKLQKYIFISNGGYENYPFSEYAGITIALVTPGNAEPDAVFTYYPTEINPAYPQFNAGPVLIPQFPANSDYDGPPYIISPGMGAINQYYFGKMLDIPVPLYTIVDDISARSGLQFGEVDTSTLVDLIAGYCVSNNMPGRAAIEPLMKTHFFDAVESNAQVKFVRRGIPPSLTIEGNMIIKEPGNE